MLIVEIRTENFFLLTTINMNQDQIQETVTSINRVKAGIEDTEVSVSNVTRQIDEAVNGQVWQINRVIGAAEDALGRAEGDSFRKLQMLIDELGSIKSLLIGIDSEGLKKAGHGLREIGASLEEAATAASRIEPTE